MDIYTIASYIGDKTVEGLCAGAIGYCCGLVAGTDPKLFGLALIVSNLARSIFRDTVNFAFKHNNSEKAGIYFFVNAVSNTFSIVAFRHLELIGNKGTAIFAGLSILRASSDISTMHRLRKLETLSHLDNELG